MNTLVSFQWLKEFIEITATPEEVAARVSLSGPGIEKLHLQAPLYDKLVIGQVLALESHPNAENLQLVTVNIGQQQLRVVCGGANVMLEQWVVVATIGAKVRWHGEEGLVELKTMTIRGVESQGMICAANEIGLFDAFPHGEKEILDLGKWLANDNIKFIVGQSLVECLQLDDVVMDVEVTTNRPDMMGMVGFAREVAAILQCAPNLPCPHEPNDYQKFGPTVQVEEPKLCPRFTALRVDGVKVGSSPWWLKRRLLAAGVRPINNLVDITNYVLLEWGRPMHVFDADKISGALVVRRAKKGETIAALNGQTYNLDRQMVVVADDDGPQAIAGIMGGENSSVTLQTKNVIFECATWGPVNIRRTARALHLSSDSQQLFEKGLSVESVPLGIFRAVELCHELMPKGLMISTITDVTQTPYVSRRYNIKLKEVTKLIGVPISVDDCVHTLECLGFVVTMNKDRCQATVPWWRDHDIESGRDLVEEIARIYGYANIPGLFPPIRQAARVNHDLEWEKQLRQELKSAGCIEVMTYSMVSENMLAMVGLDALAHVCLQNPLSQEFIYLRTQLMPSVLQVAAENQERRETLSLFEIANTYHRQTDGQLPLERADVVVVMVGDNAFKRAKGVAERLMEVCGLEEPTWLRSGMIVGWHPGRVAVARVKGDIVLQVGEISEDICKNFKLDKRVAVVSAQLPQLLKQAQTRKKYIVSLSFPEAKRDLAIIVDRDVMVGDIMAVIKQTSALINSVDWFDTFIGQGVPDGKKSLAFHLTFAADHTLITAEVDQVMQEIEVALVHDYQAIVRR